MKIKAFSAKNRKRLIKWAILAVFIIIACFNGLQVARYGIASDKVTTPLRIVHISDLHNTSYGKNQNRLLKKITEAEPALILLTGDIYHDFGKNINTRVLLSQLSAIAPAYFVTGNHEIWSEGFDAIIGEIKSYGITVLSDEFAETEINGDKIIIAGINDPAKDYNQIETMQEAFGELAERDGYKILLAHRPENIEEYKNYPFDLVLSGHDHGGQVRVPFLINGLYAPNQGIFPKYAGGLYEHEGLTHVVSRGLTRRYSAIIRVFNRPELVIITVGVE